MACPTICVIAVFNCCNAALWLFTNNPMLVCRTITNVEQACCGRNKISCKQLPPGMGNPPQRAHPGCDWSQKLFEHQHMGRNHLPNPENCCGICIWVTGWSTRLFECFAARIHISAHNTYRFYTTIEIVNTRIKRARSSWKFPGKAPSGVPVHITCAVTTHSVHQ